MRRKSRNIIVVTFAVVTVAAAAGCHSGSSRAAAPGTASASASTAPTGAASTSGATPSGTPRGTATATPGASQSAVPTATTTRAATTTPPGKPSGFTRPGTYTYNLSGTASQPFGGTQTVSGTGTLTADPPAGSTQHSKMSGQNGSQDLTLAARAAGLYVNDINISQPGFAEDFRPVGAALYFPASYHVGSRWSWQAKSTDGKYTLNVTSAITGTSTQTIGGHALRTLVVDSTLHITGAGFDITVDQRDYVSVNYALVVREHAVSHGTAYGMNVSSDITRVLRSTTPQ